MPAPPLYGRTARGSGPGLGPTFRSKRGQRLNIADACEGLGGRYGRRGFRAFRRGGMRRVPR